MLDQIRALLETDRRISDWIIRETSRDGHQIYTSLGEQEAIRAVTERRWEVEILTPLNSAGGEPRTGRTSLEIVEGERNPGGRIETAIEQARLHGIQLYDLPGPGLTYPDFNDADPDIRDRPWDTINRLRDALRESVDHEDHVDVASSEFFIDHSLVRLLNARGLDLTSEYSKLTWDICLLYRHGDADTEFWEMKFRPGARYVNVKDDIARFAQYARDAASAQVPRSGTCPVVLTGDHLYVLLQYFMHHSSAAARYQNASLFEPGKPVLPDTARGDALTIYSNAVHPGGIRSWRFDGEGYPGARTAIIENGILSRYWAGSQYANYLDIPQTGVFGNFDIPAGSVSWDDLFKSNDRVILVVQFSTFDPQPVAGNYLGEIRVGYEFRADGTVIPLRGGSVTGNVVQGMLNCQFCRERETFYGYVGPRGIRFEHAQIAGD